MSLFDPQSLLQEDLESNATRRTANPPGETVAQITKLDFKSGKAGPKAKHPGQEWTRLNVSLEITDPSYLNDCPSKPDKVTMIYGVMLDMTPEGRIAVGDNKNLQLGRLRSAAGVNGRPLDALMGQFIRIQIINKPHPDGEVDPETGEPVILDDISAVAKA